MKKTFLSIVCMMALWGSVAPTLTLAATLPDGAYIIERETSYVNPETGKTVDGGTNIALGDSMCASIVEDHMLVEQTNGKTYLTIGIGLMSNVKDVRVQVKDQNGTYKNAELTLTGSCQRDGDTCQHYRFEVRSMEEIISPILYVTPMGRDVQFFVVPDISTAKEETGNFVSEMIPEEPEIQEPAIKEEPAETIEEPETTTDIPETEIEQPAQEEQENNSWLIGGGLALVAVVVGGILILSKKKERAH